MTSHDNRRYPVRPVLGVGALIFEQERVLLVERGRPPLMGEWSLPGGGVEAAERLEDAVVREVLEETGLNVSADSLALVFERIMPDPGGQCEYHYVLIDFYCSVQGGELRPGDDSRSVAWFAVDSLDSVVMTAGTREVIRTCFERAVTQSAIMRP
ncbi:MAG: NUDIX hydrolase [Bryobacteraceae bacterium]